MTIYEPNPDAQHVGVEFEEYADAPILAEDRPPPDPDRETELPEHLYGLVSILHQARGNVVRHRALVSEAHEAGDEELAQWAGELADADRRVVSRAKSMLAARLQAH